ncbi:hypothetical protein C8F04DRAFT_1140977 [Mycena alexandri]|uniref:Uncharacterized protein n=1 Tax=Mycena alexandri TaxID=1745969 RepID=A0AAD6S5W4_9AGAR|nr:hypothetical protein C8F04DRAFT_1140977 [Mycena alexandri]
MSLYVEGLLVHSVAFSAVPRSSISAAFNARLTPRNRAHFVFTTYAGPYASLTTVLNCDISPRSSPDVVLGLDWVSMIRESLLRAGHRLDPSFDPWALFTSAGASQTPFTPLPSHDSLQPQATQVPFVPATATASNYSPCSIVPFLSSLILC